MRFSPVLISLFLAQGFAYPWLSPDYDEKRAIENFKRMKRDPELGALIEDLYKKQVAEKEEFFKRYAAGDFAGEEAIQDNVEKRATSKCQPHPLPDFLPTNITGLKKFPEAAYPYKDPQPSDQRGPCPGLNTMANHGYIPRNGIATLAQTIIGAMQLFNMGADLSGFLAGGSFLLAGDIPSTRYSIGGADSRTNTLGGVGQLLGTETGLSGHLRFKEGDASATRCDFYLCNGDDHNLNVGVFKDLQNQAKTVGGGQYNVAALQHHFANQYSNSRKNNPYFYFFPQQAALAIGATYFVAGFFSNGTIGFGGVANEASIASFLGVQFNSDGSIKGRVPEQIPPQGWYRRGFPMFLSEGIDGIITLYTGAAAILGDPLLFGATNGTAGDFSSAFGLTQLSGTGSFGGTDKNKFACAIEEAVYGNFVSEFSTVLNTVTSALNTVTSLFGVFGCPTPSGANPVLAPAPSYQGYPKPSPCTLNKQQNGVSQCAPDTNTYDAFNTAKVPYCLNSPTVANPLSNPYPVPVPQ